MNRLSKMLEKLDEVYAMLPEYGYAGTHSELQRHVEKTFGVSKSRAYVVLKDWCRSRNIKLPTERDAYFGMPSDTEQLDVEPARTEALDQMEAYLFNRNSWYDKKTLEGIEI